MSKYLLEIGVEELPYKFIPQAIDQLKTAFTKLFEENKIDYSNMEVYGTPRRLAVLIDNLSENQPDIEKIIKGPIKNIAYNSDGTLSNAGLGFCKKNDVEEKDLSVVDNYLTAKIVVKGKNTAEVLKENIPHIILKLQGSHFMRWADFDEKFSRPIRWIVSLLDDKQIELNIMNIKSADTSRGHRFFNNDLNNQNVKIKSADLYLETLKEAKVLVNQDERKNIIIDLAQKEADKIGAKVSYSEDLLDEVTYLCEWPVAFVCDFDEKYLDIPEEVTVTVMSTHQRYFALYQKNGKLLNKFITITNYLGDDFSNIKAGNERVITARLDDAIFFFKEDTKKSLAQHVENLKGITFQKGMGSVYDKTMRIITLSKEIAQKLSLSKDETAIIERTALLCKADLTTSLVFEFTELQGFIGADYARVSNENEKVCQGIMEHYFPLNAESELAKGIEGQIVGISDKLDTICAVFLDGKKPTGSSDPLGVRRACLGIIKTIIVNNLNINVSEFIQKSIDLLPKKPENKEELIKNIEEFFNQRLIIFLSETHRKDILEACSSVKNPLKNLSDLVERVNLIENLSKQNNFSSILECANRILKITKNEEINSVDEKMLTINAERNLYETVLKINDKTYKTLVESLISATPVIEKFFEDVLVMDKDEKIKQNRLAILGMLKVKYNLIADFNKIVS